MRKKADNIFFLFGLVAIIIMILTFDVSFDEMWADLKRAGYWLIPILGMWFLLYFMNALTWQTIIKGSGECNVPFLKLFKVTVSGFALNYATPCGLMGGEPYKIMEVSPYIGVERATSSVLLFAMMHIFAHFWYWTTAVILYLFFVPLDAGMYVILPLMALFCVGGIYLFTRGYKNGLVVKVIGLISHIPGLKKWGTRFRENHIEELTKIDSQIASLHKQKKSNFYKAFGLEYVGRLCHSFEIFFMLQLVGVQGTFLELFLYSLLILAFTSLFANLMFFMPLQLGGREGGFAMSCVQVIGGVVGAKSAMTIAIFISIICRVREIFWTAIGLILIKVKKRRKLQPQSEERKGLRFAILAAGEGSRLASEGLDVPKPLVEINGEKMIDRLVRIFMDNGAEEIDIITNDITPLTQNHVRELQAKGLPVRLVVKSTPSSMHSFHELVPLLGKGKFCLTTVDTIFRENDFREFITCFRNSEADGMMAVTDFVDDEKPLYISVDEENVITGFHDVCNGQTYVSGGIYCLDERVYPVLEKCIAGGQSRMRNFQRALVENGFQLQAYCFSKILDVDHVADIAKAEKFLREL